MTYDDFDIETQEIILQAQSLAARLNHEEVTLVHIVLMLMKDEDTREVMEDALDEKGSFVQLQEKVFQYLPSRKSDEPVKQYLSDDANRALQNAKKLSKLLKFKQITEEVLLAAVTAMDHSRMAEIFDEEGIEPLEVLKSIEYTK